jgi:hypothetical protein
VIRNRSSFFFLSYDLLLAYHLTDRNAAVAVQRYQLFNLFRNEDNYSGEGELGHHTNERLPLSSRTETTTGISVHVSPPLETSADVDRVRPVPEDV